jgi:hypothetical protein
VAWYQVIGQYDTPANITPQDEFTSGSISVGSGQLGYVVNQGIE